MKICFDSVDLFSSFPLRLPEGSPEDMDLARATRLHVGVSERKQTLQIARSPRRIQVPQWVFCTEQERLANTFFCRRFLVRGLSGMLNIEFMAAGRRFHC